MTAGTDVGQEPERSHGARAAARHGRLTIA
jgi:hypothetical protein